MYDTVRLEGRPCLSGTGVAVKGRCPPGPRYAPQEQGRDDLDQAPAPKTTQLATGREESMKDLMLTFWQDESGQDMAEYALLLALIALAIITAVIAFRGAIIGRFQQATTQLQTP
jgi:pilus assembly protein Flp/PilA